MSARDYRLRARGSLWGTRCVLLASLPSTARSLTAAVPLPDSLQPQLLPRRNPTTRSRRTSLSACVPPRARCSPSATITAASTACPAERTARSASGTRPRASSSNPTADTPTRRAMRVRDDSGPTLRFACCDDPAMAQLRHSAAGARSVPEPAQQQHGALTLRLCAGARCPGNAGQRQDCERRWGQAGDGCPSVFQAEHDRSNGFPWVDLIDARMWLRDVAEASILCGPGVSVGCRDWENDPKTPRTRQVSSGSSPGGSSSPPNRFSAAAAVR